MQLTPASETPVFDSLSGDQAGFILALLESYDRTTSKEALAKWLYSGTDNAAEHLARQNCISYLLKEDILHIGLDPKAAMNLLCAKGSSILLRLSSTEPGKITASYINPNFIARTVSHTRHSVCESGIVLPSRKKLSPEDVPDTIAISSTKEALAHVYELIYGKKYDPNFSRDGYIRVRNHD